MPPQQHQQQQGGSDPAHYQSHYSSKYEGSECLESQGYPMFSHDHTHQRHQQHDAFVWHHQKQQHLHNQQRLPVMTFDPLPILHSSFSEHQRVSVSIEDEIFEACMLEEALRDCGVSSDAQSDDPRRLPQNDEQGHHHSSFAVFQPQSIQTQLMFTPQFANVTTPNNALLRRSSLTQQVLSPVENLRNYSIQYQHEQPTVASSPSSYSSSSSSGSPVVGFPSLLEHTSPTSLALSAPNAGRSSRQPKKRVQAARICQIDGCTRGIRSRGLCKAHGGGRRCTTPGCTTSDQGGGHCVLHGGGRRCIVDGCMKSAQWRGVCKLHGGARRCRYGGCIKNGQVKQGYCRLHYNLVARQRLESLLVKVGQQEGQVEADSESKDEHEHEENENHLFPLESYL